jgi:hypothetical protein
MAYDSTRDRIVLFGGSSPPAPLFYGDTWEWDGHTWTLAARTGPPARFAHAMTFDGALGVTVLFGGPSGVAVAEMWIDDVGIDSQRIGCPALTSATH